MAVVATPEADDAWYFEEVAPRIVLTYLGLTGSLHLISSLAFVLIGAMAVVFYC